MNAIEKLWKKMDEQKFNWLDLDQEFEHPLGDKINDGNGPAKKAEQGFIQPRAEYYWDNNDKLNFELPAWWKQGQQISKKPDPSENIVVDVPKGHCPSCGQKIEKIPGKRLPKYCSDSCRKSAQRKLANKRKQKFRAKNSLIRQAGIVPDRYEPFVNYVKRSYVGAVNINGNKRPILNKEGLDKLVRSESEKKPKGVKPERYPVEPCECGSSERVIYKPWKPENGAYGKIGSRILCCKKCGLVIPQNGQKHPVENLV